MNFTWKDAVDAGVGDDRRVDFGDAGELQAGVATDVAVARILPAIGVSASVRLRPPPAVPTRARGGRGFRGHGHGNRPRLLARIAPLVTPIGIVMRASASPGNPRLASSSELHALRRRPDHADVAPVVARAPRRRGRSRAHGCA
jgi:hypothetical protein